MAKKEEKMINKEMTTEEAKAYRASLHKPTAVVLTDGQKREEFRVFWAQEKRKYAKTENLEQILWVHLKAVKLDSPEKFQDGIKHFGLKKI